MGKCNQGTYGSYTAMQSIARPEGLPGLDTNSFAASQFKTPNCYTKKTIFAAKQFTSFASAADLFFHISIDFNCFSIEFVALNRFSIDLHSFLEISVDFQFDFWFSKVFLRFFVYLLTEFEWHYIDLHRFTFIFRDSYRFSLIV